MADVLVKVVVVCTFWLASFPALSQSQDCDAYWILYLTLYQTLLNYDDERTTQQTGPDLTPIGDSLLAHSDKPYARYTHVKESAEKAEEILFIKKKSGKTRTTYVLVEDTDYYVLCARRVQDPCDCDSYVSMYIPDVQLYKNTERPFSFSLRRDLADALNKYAGLSINRHEYEDQCSLLMALGAK